MRNLIASITLGAALMSGGSTAAAAQAAEIQIPEYNAREATRCGILNVFTDIVLGDTDAELSRQRNANAMIWFAIANDKVDALGASLDPIYAEVEQEVGTAAVAQPPEGSARMDHLLAEMESCDRLRDANLRAYTDMVELLTLVSPEEYAGRAAFQRQGTPPKPVPPRDDSRYLYELTYDAALRCAVIQDELFARKRASYTEWARYHEAMTATWLQLAAGLKPGSDSFADASAAEPKIEEGLDEKPDPIAELHIMARPCEVMSNINSDMYRGAAALQAEQRPDIFADSAAYKNQTAGEYPEAPQKEIMFGDWFFFARGNLCFAARAFDDGAKLTLGFNNFFDGSIKFEWSELPEMDVNSDRYEELLALHDLGSGPSPDEDDYLPIITEGYDYDSFPGTGIFVDQKLIGTPFGMGQTDGREYVFGSPIQRAYYTLLPVGKELSIQVLGRETHKVSIDDPAMWNEISNCMAQYPFG